MTDKNSSPEARERRNAKKRAARAAKRARLKFDPRTVRKGSPEYRRSLPKFTETSKSALRAMLALAVENTAAANG